MRVILWSVVVMALLAGCGAASKSGGVNDGRVAISVTEQGFEPDSVTVPVGKPVTLVVTRRTTKTCATDLVMPAENINRPLPLGQAVEITFTPETPGTLEYACAMGMYKGKVVVK